jgi:hypothetical protein
MPDFFGLLSKGTFDPLLYLGDFVRFHIGSLLDDLELRAVAYLFLCGYLYLNCMFNVG